MQGFEEYVVRLPEISYQGIPELRYGRLSIGAREISDHYYKGPRGRIDDPIRKAELDHHSKLSDEAHRALLELLPDISWEDALKKVRSGEPLYLWEFYLEGRSIKGVRVSGRPDLTIFNEGKPINVVDYKFIFEDELVPRLNDYIQVRINGWLLNGMGSDISELFYTLILSRIGCNGCKKLKSEPLKKFFDKDPANKKHLWECKCELGESQAACYLFNIYRLRETGEDIDHYVNRFLIEESDTELGIEKVSTPLEGLD